MAQLRSATLPLFEPDSLVNKPRLRTTSIVSGTIFLSSAVGLYNTWYSSYEQSAFHLFDDFGEWQNIDKIGHVYTAYFQTEMCFKAATWTGLSKKRSIVIGAACGLVLQSTVEVFDGFSTKWGFSVYDFTSNVLGVAAFASQQSFWDEQRIRIKIMSTFGRRYPGINVPSLDGQDITTLDTRRDDLFGSTIAQRFLKDYNAQTYWLSVNLHSFGVQASPEWLAIAIGFGGEEMYGGFENAWSIDGVEYVYKNERYLQFYLSPDIDWSKVRTKSPFVRTVFSVLNIYKLPLPAVEYNVRNGWSFHLAFVH